MISSEALFAEEFERTSCGKTVERMVISLIVRADN
jgi:hypothetical protein